LPDVRATGSGYDNSRGTARCAGVIFLPTELRRRTLPRKYRFKGREAPAVVLADAYPDRDELDSLDGAFRRNYKVPLKNFSVSANLAAPACLSAAA